MSEQLTQGSNEPQNLNIDQQMVLTALGFENNQQAATQVQETQVQPTQVQEPVSSEPVQAQVPPQEINIESFLEKEFGVKDVSVIKQKFTEYDTLQNDLQTLKSQPKFKTGIAEQLDNLLDGVLPQEQPKVIAEIARFMSLDENSLEAKDLLAFDMKLKYPNLTEDEVSALINRKYALSDFATDEEKTAGAAQMKIDSLEAKKNITDLKHKTLNTNPAKAQADLAAIEQEGRMQKLQQLTDNSLKKFQSISLKTDKLKDIADFVVDNNALGKIKDNVFSAMVTNNVEPTEENVLAIAKNIYLLENFDHVVNHLATQLQSKQLQTEIQTYHNADPNKSQSVTPKVMTEQDVKNSIAQQLGII